ncbi:hypothetical protein FHS29_006867 [Saccharothrix tamanrassetensis]|uniref:Lipoprotein n=1 Tax=Saccharothrix tamanrassetensis TaxID=1051531 RepID=A0A841CVA5_9PSEU|nr:hypothetical protein [Saccharothrix tamanrassetensis]MBB5960244.1 hypothetical protein [Saccharothrix tamanrassetensis]
MLRRLGLLATVLAVAGCGSGTEDLARRAADEFASAVSAGDSARICSLLTERAREHVDCAAVDLPGGEVEEVVVWGDAARARTASDTLFLRELAVGWRVSGAGCHPVPDRPYSCEVGGP